MLLTITLQVQALARQYEECWQGTLGRNIPVFLHFQQSGNLIVGEIIYLKTKSKIPITTIGIRDTSEAINLKEFDKDGNISGIMQMKQNADSLTGIWFQPRSTKEFNVRLKRADTLLPAPDIQAKPVNIFGDYRYHYGEEGYAGYMTLEKLNDRFAELTLSSVTSAPGRNIADIGTDTIPGLSSLTINCALRIVVPSRSGSSGTLPRQAHSGTRIARLAQMPG